MLTLLKLGGSLITDKHSPQTAKLDVIARLAGEILRFWQANPDLQLIMGHGSGSFGHVSARKFGTRMGVKDREGWLGFAKVWKDARALNDIVLEKLTAVGLPIIAMPPSATVIASNGVVHNWNLEPIQSALSAGLIPLINGDTIFDRELGGTILSTEDLFIHLGAHLPTDRILLAGIEDGVWADYPVCQQLIHHITPDNYSSTIEALTGSAAIDVTGGMAEKVTQMIRLVKKQPHIKALIFSGLESGNIERALAGQFPGTRISANDMNRES
jgi:isopentenyl phosphate kinase